MADCLLLRKLFVLMPMLPLKESVFWNSWSVGDMVISRISLGNCMNPCVTNPGPIHCASVCIVQNDAGLYCSDILAAASMNELTVGLKILKGKRN